MQSASTETFSVSFPAVYDQIRITWESITGEHNEDDGFLSFAAIGLQQLSFYNKYKGDELSARFRESCLEQRGPVEVIADKTLPVAGLPAEIRTVQSADGYFYYFGLVPISSEFGYAFIADCDSSARAYFEPVFDEIWQSLRYFGDPSEALTNKNTAINKIISNHQPANTATTTREAEQEIKNITPFSVPEDGRECWQIGDHPFTLNGVSLCYISGSDGALYVKIEAQSPDDADQEHSDIINDYNDGKVYLQFYFKGIYNAGIPTGKFHFEQERENTYMAFLWKGGFHYLQSLTAEITLQEGWLGINGYFNEYPVKLAVKLPVENLAWENYLFLGAREVSTAPPEIVRRLWLTDPYPGILQETLQPLTQLQVLSIDFRDSKQAADFKEVPHALKRLHELKELSLTGVAALDSLPPWLGDLKKLEKMRLSGSRVEDIPSFIFQLPALKKLDLSDNQLQSIHPALPDNLETLTLRNNRLTSVPESVTRLQYLNIENNPLQHLPAGLINMPQLDLELEKKITLLDYTYTGADGRGTISYDDSRFYAKYDPELLAMLGNQIIASGLERFAAGLVNRTRKSVALATTEADTYSVKGNHRFGGLPDLPPGISYPSFIDGNEQKKGLQFIAQINCAAIAHLQDYLPGTGILYFFIKDQEAMEPMVLYYDGDSNELQSAKELAIETEFIYDDRGLYTPFKAEAGKYPGIPNMYNAGSLYPELAGMENLYDETEQLEKGLKAGPVSPVHSMNAYVFKQHGTPEMEAVGNKRGKPEEWMVLLRVSSDNNPGFNFWDAGEIYFVIHKSDLEKKDFSNVYCGLESS